MKASELEDWRNQRRHKGLDPADSTRTPAQRDRDRLLYSPAFRRLQAVTQVMLAADEGYLQHNRLTHSLKVAQVGRRIAERLLADKGNRSAIAKRGGLDPDVVEAAGLAHDLGHPPFGHIAEYELQRLIGERHVVDSFEGNAQSFRIVTKLSAIYPDYVGLDLTRATLNAVLKYPWTRSGRTTRKWGAYSSEQADFDWARDGFFADKQRSLEAEIMDWADDITYAIHDIEDFFRLGLIPLGSLRYVDSELLPSLFDRVIERLADESDPRYRMAATQDDLRLAWSETMAIFTLERYSEGATERSKLNQYSSGLIDTYIKGTRLGRDGALDIAAPYRLQIALLKELTKAFVVEAPALATQQVGQRKVIRSLFKTYVEALTRESSGSQAEAIRRAKAVFPSRVAEDVEATIRAGSPVELVCRVAADSIAGMTEAQALQIGGRFMGIGFGSLLDPAAT